MCLLKIKQYCMEWKSFYFCHIRRFIVRNVKLYDSRVSVFFFFSYTRLNTRRHTKSNTTALMKCPLLSERRDPVCLTCTITLCTRTTLCYCRYRMCLSKCYVHMSTVWIFFFSWFNLLKSELLQSIHHLFSAFSGSWSCFSRKVAQR